MDENTWRFAQLMMWLIGIQTALLTAILGCIWNKLSKMDDRVNDIDKRVFGIEMMMHRKDCCMIKDDSQVKKAG